MRPQVVSKETFTVIGLKCRVEDLSEKGDSAMANIWERFLAREQELSERVDPEHLLGITIGCLDSIDGVFTYIACAETSADAPVPKGMSRYDFDALTFAIFPHEGGLDSLGYTFDCVFDEWLPASALKPSNKHMDAMEVYLTDSLAANASVSLDLWIPIEQTHLPA